MLTRFEHFAATALMGSPAALPRQNGQLRFHTGWEQAAFGVAIALSKQGYYEWEDFRQCLMQAIGDWEARHTLHDPGWDYYQCWLSALEKLAIASGVITQKELAHRMTRLLTCATSAAVEERSDNG